MDTLSRLSIAHSLLNGQINLSSERALSNATDESMAPHVVQLEPATMQFQEYFEPDGLLAVYDFIFTLQNKFLSLPRRSVICFVNPSLKDIQSGVFLLGCFMMISEGMTPNEIRSEFLLQDSCIEELVFDHSEHIIGIYNCWEGLFRAKQRGWVDLIDMEEYAHYDNPLEGDLHTIIPGHLIAFKGPRTVSSGQTYEDRKGRRSFSPEFFVEPFQDMEVRTVVRLNEREYADAEFEDHGIRCVSLEFEDTLPPPDVVIAFLHTMRAAKGAVAVHCRSGLGRTGTLCALHLMLSHGFTACEAIAWVRIVRPGSIQSEQHQHLTAVHSMLTLLRNSRDTSATLPNPPPPPSPPACADTDDESRTGRAPLAQPEAAEPPRECAPSPPRGRPGRPCGDEAAAAAAPMALAHRAVFRTQVDLGRGHGERRPRPESPHFGHARPRTAS
jgi:hypothetical protein